MTQVQSAMEMLSGAAALPDLTRELKDQTNRASEVAQALSDDYEALEREIMRQREVTIQLCAALSGLPVEHWRTKEDEIRRTLMAHEGELNAENRTSNQT